MKYVIYKTPITKKNSQQIIINRRTGLPMIIPSQQFKRYEAAAKLMLLPKPETPICYPVSVKCLFYMPDKRHADLTNLLEAADDVLQAARIIADDWYIASHDGSRRLIDRDNPRTEIYIERMCDDAE